MRIRYPWWKWSVIAIAIVAGLFYASPNLFGEDPGLAIRGKRGIHADLQLLTQLSGLLDAQEVQIKKTELRRRADTTLRLQFENEEIRDRAQSIIGEAIGSNYTIAATNISAEPALMTQLNAKPVHLGLDLQGGVHLLLEVGIQSVIRNNLERSLRNYRTWLRENNVRYRTVSATDHGVEIRLRDPNTEFVSRMERDFEEIEIDTISPTEYFLKPTKLGKQELIEAAINQNLAALRSRIDALGVSEPLVQRQGERRIVIELPGIQDPARAKEILGRAATLEFRLVDEDSDPSLGVPSDTELHYDRFNQPLLLNREVIYTGDNIVNAAASLDTINNTPIVSITLDGAGESINRRVTAENIGRRMAVVYLEQITTPVQDESGDFSYEVETIREVITAPVIRDQLGRRYQIEGLHSVQEAHDLALLLRAGALAAPVVIVEERTVGPSLGEDNIRQGVRSIVIAFAFVLLFMFYYYRLFGWLANLALSLNLIMILALLSLLQATLTLPGVVGLVLTIGMAVDANVLIFERIREELRNGNSALASLRAGYERAFSTIIDANITTLIAALVLFNYGSGPIRGFAVTLSLGILTSMFTSIVITKGIALAIYTRKKAPRLAI